MEGFDKVVNTEFEKFKKDNANRSFNILPIYNPCSAFSDILYQILEIDNAKKPIHRVAEIEVNDLIGDYKVSIKYREKWYPSFGVNAQAIKNAFKEDKNYQINISTVIDN